MAYTLSGTGVIHEFLHDEVIVANLDAGIYYSIRGSGILVWQLLLAGYSASSIDALFSEKYGADAVSVLPLIERLVAENLIVPQSVSAPSPISLSWSIPFEPPSFERYDEMKNLLMLDPIHEVDEQGWPHRK
jgi:hypothetical protein